MKKHLITLGIVCLFSLHAVHATETTADTAATQSRVDTVVIAKSVTSGYILFDPAVNKGDDHELRFAVVKTTGAIQKFGTWQVQFDFASMTLVAAQAEYKHDLFGGTFQGFAGSVFPAGGQITVAPNGLYAPNWSSVYLPFTFTGDGIGMQFTYKQLDAYLVSTNRTSAAATFKGLEALWEDHVGTEVGYTTPYKVLGAHPSMKALFFADHGKTQHASSFWVGLGHGLRFYQLSKWGRTEGYSAGITYDVQSIRLKWFYDLTNERHFAEFICSF